MDRKKTIITSMIMQCIAVVFSFIPCIYDKSYAYRTSGELYDLPLDVTMKTWLESMSETGKTIGIIMYILMIVILIIGIITLFFCSSFKCKQIKFTNFLLFSPVIATLIFFVLRIIFTSITGYITDVFMVGSCYHVYKITWGFYIELAFLIFASALNFLISKKLLYNHNENAETSTILDDIEKYKELLDKGIITQEEFDTKKKQLLGL